MHTDSESFHQQLCTDHKLCARPMVNKREKGSLRVHTLGWGWEIGRKRLIHNMNTHKRERKWERSPDNGKCNAWHITTVSYNQGWPKGCLQSRFLKNWALKERRVRKARVRIWGKRNSSSENKQGQGKDRAAASSPTLSGVIAALCEGHSLKGSHWLTHRNL